MSMIPKENDSKNEYSDPNVSAGYPIGKNDSDHEGGMRTDGTGSDRDASGDEDIEMDKTAFWNHYRDRRKTEKEVARLRPRSTRESNDDIQQRGERSEDEKEDMGSEYQEEFSDLEIMVPFKEGGEKDVESGTEGEEEKESGDENPLKAKTKKGYYRPSVNGSSKSTKMSNFPAYAQHAYLNQAYNVPKLPVPLILLPGLRSRKAPPLPVPDVTKKSRGRKPIIGDDGSEKKYQCVAEGCGKRFSRGEHLKRHIRSIHTHEKPHNCPYPGCGRGFSRTDNMMQHMRTHEDWPDEETAKTIMADTKKLAEAKSSKNMLSPFLFPPFFPPMAWPQGVGGPSNMSMPFPFPFMPPVSPVTGANGDSGKLRQDGQAAMAASLAPYLGVASGDTVSENMHPFSSLLPNHGILSSGMLPIPNLPPIASTSTAEQKHSKKVKARHARVPSKADTLISVNSDATAPPSTPISALPDTPVDPPTSLPLGATPNLSLSRLGMPPFPMQLPPGMSLPAIAIPIPPGAALPPASQLPPNAQTITDDKGGVTIIIPPPPLPFGLPFAGAPGAISPDLVPLAHAPAPPTSSTTTDEPIHVD